MACECIRRNIRHVAQFNRDSFVFSRLQPYQSWEQLEQEAIRLWEIYMEIAKPRDIQRLGVRFVNRIPMAPKETRFEDYIQPHPQTPRDLDLPFLNFLHKETFVVPESDFGINRSSSRFHWHRRDRWFKRCGSHAREQDRGRKAASPRIVRTGGR